MAIRTNQLVNFKGEPYATVPEVEKKIQKSKISVSGSTGTPADGSNILQSLKVIGDCKIIYGNDGQITLRIGPALNSSLFNGTDGISVATVTDSLKTVVSADISSALSTYANTGSRNVAVKGEKDTFTANCGATRTSVNASGVLTKGNAVHFEGDGTCKFKVYVKSGKGADTETSYYFGPVKGSDMDTNKAHNYVTNGITCAITNYYAEPKSDSGASGYCANVNFTIALDSLFSTTTDFQITKIEQIEITVNEGVEKETVVADWINDDTNVYMYLADTTKPGIPTGATYSLSRKEKTISGVTYLTTETTLNPKATGLTNCGYPGYVTNKLNCAYSGGQWFSSFNETSTDAFTTWTTEKGTTMDWTNCSITKSILKGTWDNPQITVKGTNIIGSGTGVTSAETNNKICVCDTSGSVSSVSGTYTDETRFVKGFGSAFSSTNLTATNNADLQTFDGCIVYPTKDFSVYNKNGATAINPNYSNCTGTRYAYLKLTKSGTIMGGTVTIKCIDSPKDALTDDEPSLKIQLSNKPDDETSWMDLMDIGTSFSYGTTTDIGFSIPQASSYGTGMMYCRVVMTKPAQGQGVKIKEITLG